MPDKTQNKYLYLSILLAVSIVSHFPFVLDWFGEMDATKIAVSVIDMINNRSNNYLIVSTTYDLVLSGLYMDQKKYLI